MNIVVAILNAFQSVLMSHTQIYPHAHPHVDVSTAQDTGLSLGFMILLIAVALLASSLVGFFVGKTVTSRRYIKK